MHEQCMNIYSFSLLVPGQYFYDVWRVMWAEYIPKDCHRKTAREYLRMQGLISVSQMAVTTTSANCNTAMTIKIQ
jgi:hypothetical protein